jgi:hypothetical protein
MSLVKKILQNPAKIKLLFYTKQFLTSSIKWSKKYGWEITFQPCLAE